MPSGERRNQSVLWGGERDWMRPRPTRREQTQQHSSTSTSTSTSTKRARWQGEDDEEDDQINGLPDRLELRRARVPSARLMPQLLYPFVPIKYVISCSIWEQAKDLHFLRPKQEGYLKKDGVKFNDITIMRFGPGQAIELEAYAVKGMRKGKRYQLLLSQEAHTLCRECVIMGPSGEQVGLKRVRDHFICKYWNTCHRPPFLNLTPFAEFVAVSDQLSCSNHYLSIVSPG
uniref:Uncharacterized protein n=1 Tax=Oryza nivara TaxID=4536 RepID=A0A0E0IC45_ORYNI